MSRTPAQRFMCRKNNRRGEDGDLMMIYVMTEGSPSLDIFLIFHLFCDKLD